MCSSIGVPRRRGWEEGRAHQLEGKEVPSRKDLHQTLKRGENLARIPLLGSDTPHTSWLAGCGGLCSGLSPDFLLRWHTHQCPALCTPKAQANNDKRKRRAARVRGGGGAGEGPGRWGSGARPHLPWRPRGRFPAATLHPGGAQGCGGCGGSGSAQLGLHCALSEPPAAQDPAARGRSGRGRGGGRPGPVAPAVGSASPPRGQAASARRPRHARPPTGVGGLSWGLPDRPRRALHCGL